MNFKSKLKLILAILATCGYTSMAMHGNDQSNNISKTDPNQHIKQITNTPEDQLPICDTFEEMKDLVKKAYLKYNSNKILLTFPTKVNYFSERYAIKYCDKYYSTSKKEKAIQNKMHPSYVVSSSISLWEEDETTLVLALDPIMRINKNVNINDTDNHYFIPHLDPIQNYIAAIKTTPDEVHNVCALATKLNESNSELNIIYDILQNGKFSKVLCDFSGIKNFIPFSKKIFIQHIIIMTLNFLSYLKNQNIDIEFTSNNMTSYIRDLYQVCNGEIDSKKLVNTDSIRNEFKYFQNLADCSSTFKDEISIKDNIDKIKKGLNILLIKNIISALLDSNSEHYIKIGKDIEKSLNELTNQYQCQAEMLSLNTLSYDVVQKEIDRVSDRVSGEKEKEIDRVSGEKEKENDDSSKKVSNTSEEIILN
jgi:hypothetical protein